jgi:raffinose/stachyose/melibiose transport system permease protein
MMISMHSLLKVKIKRNAGTMLIYSLALFWGFATIFPLVLAVLSSFKDNAEIYLFPWQLPKSWDLVNYHKAIYDVNALRSIGNSVFVSLATAVIVLLIGLLASYAISRKQNFITKSANIAFVLAIMIPVHATLIPISTLATALSAKNQYWFLVLVYATFNMAQAIFLISGFMSSISSEIDEAAIIDGCNELQLLFRILTPICLPVLFTEAIFTFVYAYGELIFSLTLISENQMYTVSRAMLSFYGEGDLQLGPIFAFIVLSAFPSTLVYVLFHRQIQHGVMSGAIKG